MNKDFGQDTSGATIETLSPSTELMSPTHHLSEELIQQEDSDRIWNELAKYKKMCEEMKTSLLHHEEKSSSLESKCAYQQSLLAEYDSKIQKKAIDLEEKLAVIASIESSTKLSEDSAKIDELSKVIKTLEADNRQYKHQDGINKLKYQVLVKELQGYREKMNTIKPTADAAVLTRESGILQVTHSSSQTSYCGEDVSTTTEGMDSVIYSHCGNLPANLKVHKECQTVEAVQNTSFATYSKESVVRHQRSYSDSFQSHHSANSVKAEDLIDSELPRPKVPRLVLRKADDDVSESTRKLGNRGQHKCWWQKEVNRLQLKLRSLRKQVVVINTSKQALTQQLDQQNNLRVKVEGSLQDAMKQQQILKLKTESLQLEISKLRADKVSAQVKLNGLEQKLKNHSDADWRRMEQEHKEMQSKYLSMKNLTKSLEEDLERKDGDTKRLAEKCTRLVQDIKQKRTLLDGQHLKVAEASSIAAMKEKEKVKLMKEVNSLSAAAEQDKFKIKTLRDQLIKAAQEKEHVTESLETTKKELQAQNLAHSRAKKLLDQSKSDLSHSMKKQEQSHQEETAELHRTCRSMQGSIRTLESLVINIADMLIEVFSEKRLKASESFYMHDRETDALAGRVREIARTALNLSELELHAFFDEESVDNVLSDDEKLKNDEFRQKVEKGLKTKHMGTHSTVLLDTFKEFILMNCA